MTDAVLGATLLLAGVKLLAGTVVALVEPALLLEYNAGGIPRWIPHSMAVLLGGAAAATWRRRLDMRALATWWALGAAAFARPSLVAHGLPEPRIELLVPVVGLVLIFCLAHPSTPGLIRLALCAALCASIVVGLALLLPAPGVAASVADVLAYTCIIAGAGLSVLVSSPRIFTTRGTEVTCLTT